jgi:CheY-like chemotaxis protein
MKRTLRILHIDDDPDTRFLMRELLREAQQPDDEVEIEWLDAGAVAEALEKWGQSTLDALFVDNRLGAREGVEDIGRLQSVWSCPIWVVTGVPDRLLQERAVRNGAAGVLAKDDLLADGRRLREAVLRSTCAPPIRR